MQAAHNQGHPTATYTIAKEILENPGHLTSSVLLLCLPCLTCCEVVLL